MQALRRSLVGLFNPQSPRKRVRDDGHHIPAQDYMIGPLERTIIRRALSQSPYMGQAIIQSVHLGMRDPLNIDMPKLLPAEYDREKWYVEINRPTGVHRLTVSFKDVGDMFSYSHAFVMLNDLPESARMQILADKPAAERGERRLSHYIDMTSLGCDPLVENVRSGFNTLITLCLSPEPDLMPWPEFEAEIRRHD